MLRDPSFRRTLECDKYKQMLESKVITKAELVSVPGGDMAEHISREGGVREPTLVTGGPEACGLQIPSNPYSLHDVAKELGLDYAVKIIEVGTQEEIHKDSGIPYSLSEYAAYLDGATADHKVLNMISLEFSGTSLAEKVIAPAFVRDLDWIDHMWHNPAAMNTTTTAMGRHAVDSGGSGGSDSSLDGRPELDHHYPHVQKYCLAGMAGAYTDFHVDFGGTSVWYHVMSGRKRFYLIPPTTANLRAYVEWANSKDQESRFFGDDVPAGDVHQVDLIPGNTLVIPSGWIHAVYTPEKSLVFGGNFLLTTSMFRQLQVHAVEEQTRTAKKYRFPNFALMCGFALAHLLGEARRGALTTRILQQAKYVLAFVRSWRLRGEGAAPAPVSGSSATSIKGSPDGRGGTGKCHVVLSLAEAELLKNKVAALYPESDGRELLWLEEAWLAVLGTADDDNLSALDVLAGEEATVVLGPAEGLVGVWGRRDDGVKDGGTSSSTGLKLTFKLADLVAASGGGVNGDDGEEDEEEGEGGGGGDEEGVMNEAADAEVKVSDPMQGVDAAFDPSALSPTFGLTLPIKKKSGGLKIRFGPAKQHYKTTYGSVQSERAGGDVGTYGTRGKKLSAAFLSGAADTVVEGVVGTVAAGAGAGAVVAGAGTSGASFDDDGDEAFRISEYIDDADDDIDDGFDDFLADDDDEVIEEELPKPKPRGRPAGSKSKAAPAAPKHVVATVAKATKPKIKVKAGESTKSRLMRIMAAKRR